MWSLPLEVTVRGEKTNGIVGPIFLFAPLALLAWRTQTGRRLLLVLFLLLLVYSQNVGTRFLGPSLPFLSLAMALALPEVGLLFVAVVIFHAISCWPSLIPRYADPYCWAIRRFQFQEASRKIPQDVYLRQNNSGYGIARLVEDNVPAGRPVLSTYEISDAYTSHEILVSFQGAFNEVLYDTFSMAWRPEAQPTRVNTFRFRPVAVQKISSPSDGAGRRILERSRTSFLTQKCGTDAGPPVARVFLAQSLGIATGLRQFARHALAELGTSAARHVHRHRFWKRADYRRGPDGDIAGRNADDVPAGFDGQQGPVEQDRGGRHGFRNDSPRLPATVGEPETPRIWRRLRDSL
jgi:hypothetical protein